MRLIKLVMVEAPPTVDNVIRPFELNFKKRFVDDIANVSDGGLRLTPTRLAGVAGNILAPSASHLQTAHIPNGWSSGRIMFAMVVEIASRDITADYEYIVGYTDHPDYTVTTGGKVRFDPNMRMYFNSITRVHMTEAITDSRGSRAWQPKINAHDQILNRSSLLGEGARRGRDGRRAATTRPSDLFRRADSVSGFGAHLEAFSSGGGNGINLTGSFTSQLRSSTRTNNSPTLNLSRSLTAYTRAASNPTDAYLGDNDDEETIRGALDKLEENSVELDPFILEIKKDSNILESGYVTFGELMEMNPDFDEDRQLPFDPLSKRRRRAGWRGDDDVASWGGSTPEAIAATIIAQSLPGIMINSMYSMVNNMVLNSYARPGEYKVSVAEVYPFIPGIDVGSSWNYFEDQCEHVLLRELTKDGLFDVVASIDANIDGDIYISIEIDGGPEERFRFPAFADALLAPTLAPDTKYVENHAASLVKLSSGVSNLSHRSHPNSVDKPGIDIALDSSRSDSRRDDTRKLILPTGAKGDW